MTTLHPEEERQRAFRAKCIEDGQECLPPREAAKLFGVDPSTIRSAKAAGHIGPVFALVAGGGPDVPFYRLADVIAHFDRTGKAKADPALLATMRENGTTFWGPGGGWLLLSERPGLRTWDEAAA